MADVTRSGRMDTRLEAEGAEFLVLGLLLTEGIEAHKTYTRYPGYDIVAVNPGKRTSARISVKSRWATNYDGQFPIRNWDFDFVVCVALNRGWGSWKKDSKAEGGVLPPVFYVIPRAVAMRKKYEHPWGMVVKPKAWKNGDGFIDNWNQVRDFLRKQ